MSLMSFSNWLNLVGYLSEQIRIIVGENSYRSENNIVSGNRSNQLIWSAFGTCLDKGWVTFADRSEKASVIRKQVEQVILWNCVQEIVGQISLIDRENIM